MSGGILGVTDARGCTHDGVQSGAPYAASPALSRGRAYDEPPPCHRTDYQRDRDRIIHSAAFRRLEYKTQVFVNHEGDMFRTRLTHSIEVAQIARTIARALGLSEDLTEAISLAHDLGHTPFGHAGQDALNACMREYGGFEHNIQSLRIVDRLEEKYPGFPGLNLTFETREGILKHCPRDKAASFGALGARFLHGGQPSLEAQVANLADAIAYNNHDVDDGLRAGLIELDELATVETFSTHESRVRRDWAGIAGRPLISETVRRMINHQVIDAIESSRAAIAGLDPPDIETVRAAPAPMIGFSDETAAQVSALRTFLRSRLYRHYRVQRMSKKAARIVDALFGALYEDPEMLPPATLRRVSEMERERGARGRARGVADYVAGMTDRFAIAEHERIFAASELT